MARRSMDEPGSPVRRDSARVVVLDGHDRVLLFETVDDHDDRPSFWLTPGGGIDPGESLAAAAVRELAEETGLAVVPAELGRPVAVTFGAWVFRSTRFVGIDWFFALVTDDTTVRVEGWTDLEREVHRGWRWWTLAALDATTDVVYPVGLAGLVRRLASGWRPDAPEPLSWAAR